MKGIHQHIDAQYNATTYKSITGEIRIEQTYQIDILQYSNNSKLIIHIEYFRKIKCIKVIQ